MTAELQRFLRHKQDCKATAAGWVRGKERIITCVSGKYRWDDTPQEVQLRLFDLNGKNISTQTVKPDANGFFSVKVPEKGMGILIRK